MIEKTFEFSGHEAPVYALEPFEDGKFFSGGGDKIISSIKAGQSPEVFGIVNTNATIYSLKFLSKNRLLLAGIMNGGIHVIDLANKKEIRLLAVHTAGVFDIKHSIVNNTIISSAGDGTVCFWSADDFELLKAINLCKEKVRCLSISPDESYVAIGCGDGLIRLIDLKSLNVFNTFHAHNLSVNALIFHPTEPLLISGGRDAHLNIWEVSEWNNIKSIPAHNYAIYSICFSSNGKIFYTASRDKSIKAWDSTNFDFIQKLDKSTGNGHSHSVNKIITIDNLLISCGDDRKVIGWKVE